MRNVSRQLGGGGGGGGVGVGVGVGGLGGTVFRVINTRCGLPPTLMSSLLLAFAFLAACTRRARASNVGLG